MRARESILKLVFSLADIIFNFTQQKNDKNNIQSGMSASEEQDQLIRTESNDFEKKKNDERVVTPILILFKEMKCKTIFCMSNEI